MNTNTLKKFLGIVGVSVAVLVVSQSANASDLPCAKDGSGNVTDVANCYAAASDMWFAVTKVMLCSSIEAPTTSLVTNTRNCVPFYSSGGSSPVQVQTGQTQFPGQVVSLQSLMPGNRQTFYRYAYIESEPSISLKATTRFAANRTAVDGTSGSTCWTKDATIYSYASSTPTTSASCGSTPSAGVTKVLLNSLSSGSSISSYTSTNTGVSTYLVDSTGKVVPNNVPSGSMGGVTKMINIQPISYAATPTSKGLNASVNIGIGAWVKQLGNLYFMNGDVAMALTGR